MSDLKKITDKDFVNSQNVSSTGSKGAKSFIPIIPTIWRPTLTSTVELFKLKVLYSVKLVKHSTFCNYVSSTNALKLPST